MKKVKIIEPSGLVRIVRKHSCEQLKLAEMQEWVGGDIEIIYLNDNEVMIVNEKGKLQGLELNPTATRLSKLSGDFIVGTAVICDSDMIN